MLPLPTSHLHPYEYAHSTRSASHTSIASSFHHIPITYEYGIAQRLQKRYNLTSSNTGRNILSDACLKTSAMDAPSVTTPAN